MERKFNVGDRVRVVCPGSIYDGREATVISDLRPAINPRTRKFIQPGDLVHVLDLEPLLGGQEVISKPEHLRPIYDGNEKVSWSECAWQPKSITVC